VRCWPNRLAHSAGLVVTLSPFSIVPAVLLAVIGLMLLYQGIRAV
jgi:hypothetical protein